MASYPAPLTAEMSSSMPTTAGSNSTVPVFIARFTLAAETPSTLSSVFSMIVAHDAQVMPRSASVTLPDDPAVLLGASSSVAV